MKRKSLFALALGFSAVVGAYYLTPAMATMNEINKAGEIFRAVNVDVDLYESGDNYYRQCAEERGKTPITIEISEDKQLSIESCVFASQVFMLEQRGTYTDEKQMQSYIQLYAKVEQQCDTGDRDEHVYPVFYDREVIRCTVGYIDRISIGWDKASISERKLQFIQARLNKWFDLSRDNSSQSDT